MYYLCTILYRDSPKEYTMTNEVVEETGRGSDFHGKWVKRVGLDEEFRAYTSELWPISDDMAAKMGVENEVSTRRAMDILCQYLEEMATEQEIAHRRNKSRRIFYEPPTASTARDMAREILEAGHVNAMSGCPLCQS